MTLPQTEMNLNEVVMAELQQTIGAQFGQICALKALLGKANAEISMLREAAAGKTAEAPVDGLAPVAEPAPSRRSSK